ncbi:MAG TPA: hypothetical protein VFD26_02575 [Methyloceanibacter sp.]|nr:hypothetical protein [Methyloceanibacter sp.]
MEIAHQLNILIDRLHLEPGVEGTLFGDCADRLALVVVRGIDERVFGQLEQPVEDGIILLPRIAVLEIGAAGAAEASAILRTARLTCRRWWKRLA